MFVGLTVQYFHAHAYAVHKAVKTFVKATCRFQNINPTHRNICVLCCMVNNNNNIGEAS